MDGKISKEKIVIDTNIFIEFLLHQDRTAESLFLMKKIEEGTVEAFVTGYTLHSIAFTLDRRKQPKLLEGFLGQLMGGVVDLLIWYPLLEDECYQLCLGVP
jgi:predicted nucleic acid-binding protein